MYAQRAWGYPVLNYRVPCEQLWHLVWRYSPCLPPHFPLLILNSAFQKLVTENTLIDSWWCWQAIALQKRMKDHFMDFSFFLELLFFSFHFFLSWQIYFKKREKNNKIKKRVYELTAVGAVRWVATEIKVVSPLNRYGMQSANSLFSKSQPCYEGLHLLGKTLHSQGWTEPELEKVMLNREKGHRSCVFRSGLYIGFIRSSFYLHSFPHIFWLLLGACQGNCEDREEIIAVIWLLHYGSRG